MPEVILSCTSRAILHAPTRLCNTTLADQLAKISIKQIPLFVTPIRRFALLPCTSTYSVHARAKHRGSTDAAHLQKYTH